ncbi:MAG: hypothetical protein N2112_10695 [Gemmataceae bacterium]|jgi:chromosome segregation ATPase|nr:hypothetical protein [Gemmataceae bacterium]
MLKKIFAVGAVGLITAVVIGTVFPETKSHFRAWVGGVRKEMNDKITPETELKRLREEIKQLDPEINKAKRELAEARAMVVEIKDRNELAQKNLSKAEAAFRDHLKEVKSATKEIQWGQVVLTKQQAIDRLDIEEKNLSHLKNDAKALQDSLKIHEEAAALAEQYLTSLISQRDELEALHSELTLEVKKVRNEQVLSKYQRDGSKLAQAKELAANIKRKLEVQRQMNLINQTSEANAPKKRTLEEIEAAAEGKSVPSNTVEVKAIK